MESRVALVTGAARGIGRAFAERLGSDGYTVALADIRDAAEAAGSVAERGADARGFHVELQDADSVSALHDQVMEQFGRVDVLVNAAGVYPVVAYDETDLETWRRTFGINIDGVFYTCRSFVPAMVKRGWGRVINVSSSTVSFPNRMQTAYAATKGAVAAYSAHLATEVGANGVTVNVIEPGLTRTPGLAETGFGDAFEKFRSLQAIPRDGMPEDMANVLSFLASTDSAFMTGEIFRVNGGMIAL